jgi:hypothetical protein
MFCFVFVFFFVVFIFFGFQPTSTFLRGRVELGAATPAYTCEKNCDSIGRVRYCSRKPIFFTGRG